MVQKNILPNRMAVPVMTRPSFTDRPRHIAPNTSAPTSKTHVMDISCLAGGKWLALELLCYKHSKI